MHYISAVFFFQQHGWALKEEADIKRNVPGQKDIKYCFLGNDKSLFYCFFSHLKKTLHEFVCVCPHCERPESPFPSMRLQLVFKLGKGWVCSCNWR